MIQDRLQRVWWKEPMIWLVAGLPAIAVVASFITYFIASNNPDTLVNAGYQKIGLAPGKDTALEQRAAKLGLAGELEVGDGMAKLRLSGRIEPMPLRLELQLLHPTQSERDVRIQLHAAGQAGYVGALPIGLQGKWQWILEPVDHAWRLVGGLTLPFDGVVKLDGQ